MAQKRASRRRTTARRPRTSREPATPRRGLGFYGFTVRDVMTRKVVTVRDTDSLETAAKAIVDASVSGLPVVGRGGRLAGVVSQKDIVRLLNDRAGLTVPRGLFGLILHDDSAAPSDIAARARAILHRLPVRRAMSRPAISVVPETTLDEAIGLLISRGVNRLPVVTGGRVVGIVTRHDLLSGVRESM